VQQQIVTNTEDAQIAFGPGAGNALGLKGNINLTVGYWVDVTGQNANIGQSVGTPGL
jgi:hypothetical protein